MFEGQYIGSREGLIFFLKCLEEGGVLFSISSPFRRDIHIAAEEIFPYIQDPIAYLAKHIQVPRDQYSAWLQVLGDPRCRAELNDGDRCPQEVMGPPKHPDDLNSASAYYCLHHLKKYPHVGSD